jgi:TatD DNase family protein
MAARPGTGWALGWRCACCEVPLARVTIAPSASGAVVRVVARPEHAVSLCRNIVSGLPLIDTHSHVHAVPRGLAHCVVVGTSPDDWPRVASLRREPKLTIGFGVHPWYVGDAPSDWAATLERRLLECPDAIVGEIGLDRGRRGAPWDAQRAAFASQLALAARLRRPVSVHCVRAHGACLDDLRACEPPPPAVALHSFSGAAELARNYARQVAAPVYFGFSASLSLQSSSFGEAVRAVAADRLLLESDAADADDAAAGCAAVLAALADARGWSLAEAAERTRRNAHEFLAAVGGGASEPAAGEDADAVQLTDLPADLLAHVLVRLLLAHDIAQVAPACRAFRDAARLAFVERPYSGEVATLGGHTSTVFGVASSSDGHIITGSGDQTVRVWSGAPQDHQRYRSERWHGGNVRAVVPMSNGFLSGSSAGTLKLWTLFNRTVERTFHVGDDVRCVAVLPDGDHFVVGVTVEVEEVEEVDEVDDVEVMDEIRLYHVDGTLVHAFRAGDEEQIASVLAVTSDGQHVMSDSHIIVEGEATDFSVKVWSVASKSLVATCTGHADFVAAVAAMPDGKRFLSVEPDGGFRLWLINGTLENTFSLSELHTCQVMALVALPDNQHALSGSNDKTVKLFNVNNGAVLRTFTHHTSAVQALALLSDGLRFVSGSADKTARVVEHGLDLRAAQSKV